MNARSPVLRQFSLRALSLGALIIASGAVVAAEAAGPDSVGQERSRADVVAETLAARAAGTLAPAGEASGWIPTPVAHSNVSRTEVKSAVLAARRTGELVPAGEGQQFAVLSQPHYSTVTRAEVKASVIAARKAGELVPAGEGPSFDDLHAHAKTASTTRTADSANAATQVAGR